MADSRDAMLVVASGAELPGSRRVWGTGGWQPPDDREALDWLTLARLLGWGVTVTPQSGSGVDRGLSGGSRWIVLAGDPDWLGEERVGLLRSRLAAEPLLIVARAGRADRAFARLAGVAARSDRVAGRSVAWIGPGGPRTWRCQRDLEACALTSAGDTATWASLDGAPVIVSRQVGRGAVATLGFPPSEARDRDGAGTALLTHLLIWGARAPVAWLDLEGSLVLRMDDPGGAQNVYLRSWSHAKLGEAGWAAVRTHLKERRARLSIAYVGGWVDDGDSVRGVLEVAGQRPGRVPGRVYPSPLVRYHDHAGHAPGTLHDYEAECRGIQALRAAGLADVELHGHTHMHPDAASWATAPDRYEATSWFRELGPPAETAIARRREDEHPLALGLAALREYFGVHPTTLICPGDQWTDQSLERALDLGLQLVSSYYLALRDRDRFCWSTHVCAPYLNEPDAAWFAAGLPVVGYFHDRDAALEGVDWIGRWLDGWRAAGARKFLDFRELAGAVGRRFSLEDGLDGTRLTAVGDGAPALVRALTVAMRWPGGRVPARVLVSLGDRELSLEVEAVGDAVGRLSIPPASSAGWRSR